MADTLRTRQRSQRRFMKAPNSHAGSSRRPARRPISHRRQSSAAARQALGRPSKSSKAPSIPPILLEGDHPAPPAVSGPGEKFVLGPEPPAEEFVAESARLPEAYGTKKLFLSARDPHWLYAQWDLTRTQQLQYNKHSVDKHLRLRVYRGAVAGQPVSELHVHPESRHWFAHVECAGTKYAAELGFYQANRQWVGIASSNSVTTPPDSAAAAGPARFATIPPDLPLPRLLELLKQAMCEQTPLALALKELRAAGYPELPALQEEPRAEWTPARERALAGVLSPDNLRRVWMGSLEIPELIRRQLQQPISSPGAEPGWPGPLAGLPSSISSPSGGAPGGKGFRLSLNAELIVYGATEPDASVTIAGRPVQLRPDGSFSCRVTLPDGSCALSVVPVSADQVETRAADLEFTRQTDYHSLDSSSS
jgi:uncharacterized protein